MAKRPDTPIRTDPNSGARTFRDGRVEVPLAPPRRGDPKVSQSGIDIIKKYEGKRLQPYVPSGSAASGVTIGYGYDLGQRSADSAKTDLVAAGVDAAMATTLAKSAKLKGASARTFVKSNKASVTITEAQADALLAIEAPRHANDIFRAINVPLAQHQFDALVSLHYNRPKATRGKLATLINQGKMQDAAAEFDRIVYDHKTDRRTGKRVVSVQDGLVKRRAEETKLFLGN